MTNETLEEQVARASFEADCMVNGDEVNWGRSSVENPRGFKTEAMRWHAVARAAIAATPLDAMRKVLIDVAVSLAAALSLLDRAPATVAPSKKMFDQMKRDYAASLARARTALDQLETGGERGG